MEFPLFLSLDEKERMLRAKGDAQNVLLRKSGQWLRAAHSALCYSNAQLPRSVASANEHFARVCGGGCVRSEQSKTLTAQRTQKKGCVEKAAKDRLNTLFATVLAFEDGHLLNCSCGESDAETEFSEAIASPGIHIAGGCKVSGAGQNKNGQPKKRTKKRQGVPSSTGNGNNFRAWREPTDARWNRVVVRICWSNLPIFVLAPGESYSSFCACAR